jgi:hypothetical protein
LVRIVPRDPERGREGEEAEAADEDRRLPVPAHCAGWEPLGLATEASRPAADWQRPGGAGQLIRFSEILVASPRVEILRVDEVLAS